MSTQTITCTTTGASSATTATVPAFTEYRIARVRGTGLAGLVARLRGRRTDAVWQWQPVGTSCFDTRTELVRAQSRLLAGR